MCDDNGKNVRLLSDPKFEGNNTRMDYSNKRKEIAFHKTNDSDGYSIAIMNIENQSIETILFGDKKYYYDNPKYSTDGDFLVFTREVLGDNGFKTKNIFKYAFDSKEINQITKIGNCTDVDLSLDNKAIAFISYQDNKKQIYYMSLNKTDNVQLTKDNYDKLSPAFSFDNQHIYYIGREINMVQQKIQEESIFKVNIKTKKIEKLDFLKGYYISCSSGSQKNKLIAIKRLKPTLKTEYSIVEIDTKEKKERIIYKSNLPISSAIYFKLDTILKSNSNLSNLIPTINNLRFRKTPTLDGKFIRMLNKNDKLELLEKGKTETIGDAKGTWVKVKTEKGEVGWCFDAYLEEVKKN